MKEWVKVSRDVKGRKTITVTVQDDNIVAKVSDVAFSKVKTGIVSARSDARALLAEVQEAMPDGDGE